MRNETLIRQDQDGGSRALLDIVAPTSLLEILQHAMRSPRREPVPQRLREDLGLPPTAFDGNPLGDTLF